MTSEAPRKTTTLELGYRELDMLWSAIGAAMLRAEANVRQTTGPIQANCRDELAELKALHEKLNAAGALV